MVDGLAYLIEDWPHGLDFNEHFTNQLPIFPAILRFIAMVKSAEWKANSFMHVYE